MLERVNIRGHVAFIILFKNIYADEAKLKHYSVYVDAMYMITEI